MREFIVTLLVVCGVSVAGAIIPVQDKQASEKQDDDVIVLPRQDENSISRRDSMRAKLMYTKNVLEGLTMKDFDMINEAGADILLLTEGDAWVAVDSPTYAKLTEEFKTATRRLLAASKTENIEATALRFYELSTRCIDCHGHLRRIDF